MIPLLAFLLLLAAQDDPEIERKSFQVADGYEVSLFASEKDGIVKPLQIRWDAQGRLWVACGQSYPQLKPGEAADDTIVILEDKDGDGRADKSTVFCGPQHADGAGAREGRPTSGRAKRSST